MDTTEKRRTGRRSAREQADMLSRYVTGKVTALQTAYTGAARNAWAGAMLARLRRAVMDGPGSVPDIWQVTLGGMPQDLVGRGDDPSPAERAAHAALTLYAIHQQSQSKPMHVTGWGLGRSARTLGGEDDKAVKRRFDALATSASFAELLHHARGLVTQLRAAGVPLDYGRLAADLLLFQDPTWAGRVRLQWGRDYYRVWGDLTAETDASADRPAAAPTTDRGDI